jgi:hypothetical protein
MAGFAVVTTLCIALLDSPTLGMVYVWLYFLAIFLLEVKSGVALDVWWRATQLKGSIPYYLILGFHFLVLVMSTAMMIVTIVYGP